MHVCIWTAQLNRQHCRRSQLNRLSRNTNLSQLSCIISSSEPHEKHDIEFLSTISNLTRHPNNWTNLCSSPFSPLPASICAPSPDAAVPLASARFRSLSCVHPAQLPLCLELSLRAFMRLGGRIVGFGTNSPDPSPSNENLFSMTSISFFSL